MKNEHINVTFDFSHYNDAKPYDLRIPTQITVKQIIADVIEALKLREIESYPSTVKIQTKKLVMSDDDLLSEYPVTDGDVITVL